MSANRSPIFPKSIRTETAVLIAPGTTSALLTASSEGSRVNRLTVTVTSALGASAVITVLVGTSSNDRVLKYVSASTAAEGTTYIFEGPNGSPLCELETAYYVKVNLTVSGTIDIVVEGGDY